MAAPSKKRAVPTNMIDLEKGEDEDHDIDDLEDDEEFEEDIDEDDEEGQEFLNQEVTVEFEARNLEDCDFHGVRKLLSQLFLKANIDISELTDTLISQNYVGSAIKQVEFDEDDSDEMETDAEDENQVFGVISVLNLTERKNLDGVKQLKSVLVEKCSSCANKDRLAAILNDDTKQVGLILNERFINIPPQIAVPSFESLWKEVERANKKKMNYNFSHFVMVCKVCKMSLSGPSGESEIFTHINGEEEIFQQAADFSCEYSVKEEHDMVTQGSWSAEDEEMEPCRSVLVIPSDKIPEIMVKMKEAFG